MSQTRIICPGCNMPLCYCKCAEVSKSAVNEPVRLCDICGKHRPKNDVIKDIGTYGTENICKDCLQNYDPYEGIVRI